MDLSKEKTDSGLLNEIKDLMDKKSHKEPKKQDFSDDNFDEMIQELENNQKDIGSIPLKEDKPINDQLPSFGNPRPEMSGKPILLDQEEDIDMLVPAPPPELMQAKTPKLDVDRLMNVEEIYLNSKTKEKYDGFKIKEPIDARKPIFIKVDNYEETLRKMIEVKANTSEFSEILFRIENLKDSQSSNFSTLHNQLEDIQRKIIFIDTMLFEKI